MPSFAGSKGGIGPHIGLLTGLWYFGILSGSGPALKCGSGFRLRGWQRRRNGSPSEV